MIVGLLLLGILLISSGLKNTQHELARRIEDDLLGPDGFIAWAAAIIALGAIGYIPGMERPSRNLLLLIAVVIVLRNGGLFANVQSALQSASTAGPAPAVVSLVPAAPAAPTASTTSSSGGSGIGAVASAVLPAALGLL